MNDESDPEVLLRAVGSGDRQAYARLYDLHAPRLFAIALKIARSVEAAEEIVQDAFVAIWKQAGRYDPAKGSAGAWLAAIVRNRAIDHVRSAARRTATTVPLHPSIADADAILADDALYSARMGVRLKNCLAALREEHRKAILLAYYYGLTHEELAHALNQPVGTVKSWVRRGLLRLKDCLNQ